MCARVCVCVWRLADLRLVCVCVLISDSLRNPVCVCVRVFDSPGSCILPVISENVR